jgi:hypothetical protein
MFTLRMVGGGFDVLAQHGRRYADMASARAAAYKLALMDCRNRRQACVVDCDGGYASHVCLAGHTSITEYVVRKV